MQNAEARRTQRDTENPEDKPRSCFKGPRNTRKNTKKNTKGKKRRTERKGAENAEVRGES